MHDEKSMPTAPFERNEYGFLRLQRWAYNRSYQIKTFFKTYIKLWPKCFMPGFKKWLVLKRLPLKT